MSSYDTFNSDRLGGKESLQKAVLSSAHNIPPQKILPDTYKPVLIQKWLNQDSETRFYYLSSAEAKGFSSLNLWNVFLVQNQTDYTDSLHAGNVAQIAHLD